MGSEPFNHHKAFKLLTVNASSGVYATMGIADYLSDRARILDDSMERIRDFRVFDFNHIPEHPLMREEVKPVTSLSYLQSISLLLLLSTKVGRTYTNRLELLFAPELLEAICSTHLG